MSSLRSIPTDHEDRISTLPDSIISYILSFLSTKQSAATSILSKRWNPLWLSLLALDFDEQNFADFATFRHFVYSVMLLRNIALPILSFQLKCGDSSGFNPHDVNRFMEAVVQRGIQNLNLEILCSDWNFKLPQCVLTCNSLAVLKLKGLKIPFSKVNFPLLKTLHLESIRFPLNFFFDVNLMIFLHGCPVLEDLQIKDVVVHDISIRGGINFNALHKLVKANILNAFNCDFLLAWVRTATFLRIALMFPYHCQVPTFLNLTNLKIVYRGTTDELPGKWNWVIEVLQNCPKLRNLTIHDFLFVYDSSDTDEIGGDVWVDPPIVPKCLSSELRTCSLIGYEGLKCEFQFAEYILKNAKALHTMRISASDVDLDIKHQMLMKLSLCPRGSNTCKLSFD